MGKIYYINEKKKNLYFPAGKIYGHAQAIFYP